ncbi:MAG: hypothetical protein KIPDCIKN_00694 [Haliscomenobacter sp.]|nr:hypothetical protein [Haliscomenobacter sp.]
MKTSEKLVDNSISAALSAIEIYNKPDFRYRNEIFTILIINAWELLLKAKILLDKGDDINSIYVFDSHGNPKTNRNNTPLTIEIVGATNELDIDHTLKDNLLTLIEIRDTAIHFINNNPVDYLIYSLGVASLKNYQKLINDWFGKSLLEYHFYILPMGFAHHFQTFTLLELEKEPEIIQNLLANISANQEKKSENGFHFSCDIEINLRSAKKITDDTDMVVAVNPDSPDAITIVKTQKLTDRYPLSNDELWQKVRSALPQLKQNDFYRFVREFKIKDNKQFSDYNFRYRRLEEDYINTGKVATGTPSLFNEDCVRFIISEIPKFIRIE